MKLCPHGPFPVRPLPGYVCSVCRRYLVGPSKPNRDISLTQTKHPASSRRKLRGIAGYGGAGDEDRAVRGIRRRKRSVVERQAPLNEHAQRVAFGRVQLLRMQDDLETKAKARRRRARKLARRRRKAAV